MGSEAIDHLSPLAADLRAHDPDRYIATLFAPPAHREALIALYAFDHELSRVQTIVTEPMAGLVRLQWWQDVVDGFERGEEVAHPVARSLCRAVSEGGLQVSFLQQAIDGRRQPFEHEGPWDVETLERYLLAIGGSIASAAVDLLGADRADVLALATRVGQVTAAFEQLYALETSLADRKAWLPAGWLDGEHDIAGRAFMELREARRQKISIDRPTLSAFFPGTLVGVRLEAPVIPAARQSLPSAVPRLAWCWLRGRF